MILKCYLRNYKLMKTNYQNSMSIPRKAILIQVHMYHYAGTKRIDRLYIFKKVIYRKRKEGDFTTVVII